MDIVTTRVPTARLPWRQLGVLALIAVLLAAAVAVYVGSRPRLPEPFGVAANGLVAYVDSDGGILQVDPVTGMSDVIASGPGNERPIYAPDGSKLAYQRSVSGGGYDLVVRDLDTGRALVITPEPLISLGFVSWAPDGLSLVASLSDGRLLAFDSATPGPPRQVAGAIQSLGLMQIDDFNADPRDLFRPPAGDEIVFVGATSAGPALFVSNADGTDARPIIDRATSEISYSDIDTPQWSPDGTRIAVALAASDDPSAWRIHIVNADGSGLRELSTNPRARSEAHPSWAPDGTRVAFQRWYRNDDCGFCDTQPITAVGVDDGSEVEIGARNVDGYTGWFWSPDGRSILEVAQNVSERRLQIAPSDGGRPTYVEAITVFPPSWQRVAPAD